MHHTQLKAAVKKYGEDFKNDPEQTKTVIQADHNEEDAAAIIAEIHKVISSTTTVPEQPKKDTKADKIAEAQANHPTMKWYDEFEVNIQKREVRNPYTQRQETIITGWELVKKKHPKFIEPNLAVSLNSFANGYDPGERGNILCLRDERKTGDVITYTEWATEQGRDLTEDINILLNK